MLRSAPRKLQIKLLFWNIFQATLQNFEQAIASLKSEIKTDLIAFYLFQTIPICTGNKLEDSIF